MRVSRTTVLEELDRRIALLERNHGFESGWGEKRVEGKPTSVIVAFGEYRAMLYLRMQFEK